MKEGEGIGKIAAVDDAARARSQILHLEDHTGKFSAG